MTLLRACVAALAKHGVGGAAMEGAYRGAHGALQGFERVVARWPEVALEEVLGDADRLLLQRVGTSAEDGRRRTTAVAVAAADSSPPQHSEAAAATATTATTATGTAEVQVEDTMAAAGLTPRSGASTTTQLLCRRRRRSVTAAQRRQHGGRVAGARGARARWSEAGYGGAG